jgi:DNA-binding FadR family transcriptional regulator
MKTRPAGGDKVRPKKMADLVADQIRRQIVNGELREGDWLPTEPELIERFGVSRPTLREAFRMLEADSLVRVRRGPPGGARVSVPGPEAAAPIFSLLLALRGTTLDDVYAARMDLEPPAARRLAESGSGAEHDALAAELEHVAGSLEDATPFGQATVRFHQRLVELAGNRTMATVVTLLGEIMSRHIAVVYDRAVLADRDLADRNRLALRSYERLVELVRARDGAGAERHWSEHMRRVRDLLFDEPDAADRRVIDVLS